MLARAEFTKRRKAKKPEREHHYKKFPALAAYINRIGAEQRNFRRFVLRDDASEKSGRSRDQKPPLAIITIKDGEIECSNAEFAPTDNEKAAIKAELKSANFPKSVGAKDVLLLKPQLGKGNPYFELRSRETGEITMVQERVDHKDGTKAYLPWTFWSDGEWRRMEPDGPLPFWKPRTSDGKPLSNSIMVHEGAKAAQFCHELTTNPERREALAAHPWGQALKGYEHWGMIGGAHRARDADYEELRKAKPIEVVYVCDNDAAGLSVPKLFSKLYGRRLYAVRFTKDFPESWDLADPLPESLFANDHGERQFMGKPLEDFMEPATYATEQLPMPKGKRGRPAHVVRNEFCANWFHSVKPEVYINDRFPHIQHSHDEFNNLNRPYSDVDDTARLLRQDNTHKVTSLTYRPDKKTGIVAGPPRKFNVFSPSGIVAEKGDPKRFLEFMDHLIPEPTECLEMMRWCATLIARPEIKMLYGALLVSEMQGVGKGTLGEKILAHIVGMHNVSMPPESEIVGSDFNSWAGHRRLAIVHEIYAGDNWKAYHNLKSIITEQYIHFHEKYEKPYKIENWIHIFACSNSFRALRLAEEDRRWYVPRIREEKKDAQYWQKLIAWLNKGDGLSTIAWWAEEFLKTHKPVAAGEDAPGSKAKAALIVAQYSPAQVAFMEALNSWTMAEKEENKDKPESKIKIVAVSDRDCLVAAIAKAYSGGKPARQETAHMLRKVALRCEWFVTREPCWTGDKQAYFISNSEAAIAAIEKAHQEKRGKMDAERLLALNPPIVLLETKSTNFLFSM